MSGEGSATRGVANAMSIASSDSIVSGKAHLSDLAPITGEWPLHSFHVETREAENAAISVFRCGVGQPQARVAGLNIFLLFWDSTPSCVHVPLASVTGGN